MTLVEVLMAVILMGVGVAGVISMSQGALILLRGHRENLGASQVLQQRMERIRLSSWKTVTSSNGTIGLGAVFGGTHLAGWMKTGQNLIEEVTVRPYPATGNSTYIRATKTYPGGSVTITTSGNTTQLGEGQVAEATLTTRWTSVAGRTKERQAVTILSRNGVAFFNLPAAQGISWPTDGTEGGPVPGGSGNGTTGGSGNGTTGGSGNGTTGGSGNGTTTGPGNSGSNPGGGNNNGNNGNNGNGNGTVGNGGGKK